MGRGNILCAWRMNKAVVVFLKEQGFVHQLIESSLLVNNELEQVSPLALPSTQIIVSKVPPFISSEVLEKELKCFGRLVNGFR